jgi:predicted permease
LYFQQKWKKIVIFFPLSKLTKKNRNKLWFVVFNATFNNISVISWWSVLLVEETGVPAESHGPAASP